ncbi:MAG: hypothetical protein II833_07765, partial [Pseudobutyrivibrio sp.]|nr:hypothetical protein [Pseudobutyrivibrio sp.]
MIPFWYKLAMADKQAKRKVSVMLEFKEYMMLIVAALQTGYSMEKALKQSEVELKRLYSEESMLLPLVHVMNQKIGMNIQLEKAFLEFARAINIDEAISLAEIISFAKRSGGNYGKNIRDT